MVTKKVQFDRLISIARTVYQPKSMRKCIPSGYFTLQNVLPAHMEQ